MKKPYDAERRREANRKVNRFAQTCPKCQKVLHTHKGGFSSHVRWCGEPSPYNPATFWAKVDMSGGEDACWPYTGYVTPEGYGWAYTGTMKGQRTHGAHRQAWILTHG